MGLVQGAFAGIERGFQVRQSMLTSKEKQAASLSNLQKRLGIQLKDMALLEQALVHASFLNENPDAGLSSNEKLEFLGDAVIGLVVAHALFKERPGMGEGELTSLRSAVVRGQTLARVASELGLGEYLTMGKGEEAEGGRKRQSNLANTFEAVIGAVFLDQGYQNARDVVLRTLNPEIDRILAGEVPQDPKSRLQEIVQSRGMGQPRYRIAEISGPEHSRTFSVEVLVGKGVLGAGVGRRRIDAEREAATMALEALAQ